MVKHFVDL